MARTFKHWNLRYARDRVSLALYERNHPEAPWLTEAATRVLSSWLRQTDVGFEWGSGRSTLWLAAKVAHLISVEGDPDWHSKVGRELNGALADKVDYRYRKPGPDYYGAIHPVATDSLDFVLVDGDDRDRCALAAIPKLKPGGCLIVDNINWFLPSQTRSPSSRRPADGPASPDWARFVSLVAPWRTIWTSSGVADTAFWIKP
jgi:Methyltransferase domain